MPALYIAKWPTDPHENKFGRCWKRASLDCLDMLSQVSGDVSLTRLYNSCVPGCVFLGLGAYGSESCHLAMLVLKLPPTDSPVFAPCSSSSSSSSRRHHHHHTPSRCCFHDVVRTFHYPHIPLWIVMTHSVSAGCSKFSLPGTTPAVARFPRGMGDFAALDRHVEQETLQVLKALDQQAKELEALMVRLDVALWVPPWNWNATHRKQIEKKHLFQGEQSMHIFWSKLISCHSARGHEWQGRALLHQLRKRKVTVSLQGGLWGLEISNLCNPQSAWSILMRNHQIFSNFLRQTVNSWSMDLKTIHTFCLRKPWTWTGLLAYQRRPRRREEDDAPPEIFEFGRWRELKVLDVCSWWINPWTFCGFPCLPGGQGGLGPGFPFSTPRATPLLSFQVTVRGSCGKCQAARCWNPFGTCWNPPAFDWRLPEGVLPAEESDTDAKEGRPQENSSDHLYWLLVEFKLI